MYSNKKSLFWIFLFVFVLVISAVLCVFSISNALEAEDAEPAATEEITEEAVVQDPVAVPAEEAPAVVEQLQADVANAAINAEEPLTVLKDGQQATDADYTWNETDKEYFVKTSGLTFEGHGEVADCYITNENGSTIDSITFNNVNISGGYGSPAVYLVCDNNLTINIINSCSITNTNGGGIFAKPSSLPGDTLLLTGDSTSKLNVNTQGTVLETMDFSTLKISEGISLTASTTWDYAFEPRVTSFIYDSNGKSIISSGYNALCFYYPACMTINKGYLELHGYSGEIATGSGAIYVNSSSPSGFFNLGNNVKMIGAVSGDAIFAECKEGVTMEFDDEDQDCICSYIDRKVAGTVIFYEDNPEPTPGGGGTVASETAQTGDNIPGAIIALFAVIALGSYAALRSRKYNFQ